LPTDGVVVASLRVDDARTTLAPHSGARIDWDRTATGEGEMQGGAGGISKSILSNVAQQLHKEYSLKVRCSTN
jgi:hypothetical protein